MKYRVHGSFRHTGQTVVIELSAKDETEADGLANAMNVTVEKIELHGTDYCENEADFKRVEREAKRQSDARRADWVRVGIISGIAVVLAMIGLLVHAYDPRIMPGVASVALGIFTFLLVLAFAFIPTAVSSIAKHTHVLPIFILNLVGTLAAIATINDGIRAAGLADLLALSWLAALIWACIPSRKERPAET